MRYEYKVVPAPRKGLKGKDVKGAEARYANALESAMNEQAAFGWQYLRADTLPFEERQGLTGKTTSYQTLLVFCRSLDAEDRPAEEESQLPHLRATPAATDYSDYAPRTPAPSPAVASGAAAGAQETHDAEQPPLDPRREHKAAQALRAHRVDADEAARRPVPVPSPAGEAPAEAPRRVELKHAPHSLQGIGGRD